MQKIMLSAKIHRARVTLCESAYDGSCAIDGVLMDAAGIDAFEQVHIYNIKNGERFVTYAIRADDNSGIIGLYGAAAHKGGVGDFLIIASYAVFDQKSRKNYAPTLCYVDEKNILTRVSSHLS